MPSRTTSFLLGAMAFLLIDGLIELALISSMVSWLHRRAGGDFTIEDVDNPSGSTYPLHGKPLNLLVDQGHTSNGAAGTAVVAIGFGGFLALYLRHRQFQRSDKIHRFVRLLYYVWLAFAILGALLDIAALIYTFIVTYQHQGQTIDRSVVASLANVGGPEYAAYPEQTWTPQNWFAAVLELPLLYDPDRSDIHLHLTLMRGWMWNLIPLTILGITVAVLAVVDKMTLALRARGGHHMQQLDKISRQEAGSL